MTPAVEVQDLVITDHRGRRIVDGVSLTIAEGEVLGLVGESGCGKTTLSLALLGYTRRGLRVASGSVHVVGEDVFADEQSRAGRLRGSRITYVPQDPAAALNPARRIDAQLDEMLGRHEADLPASERTRRIGSVLREVGLPDDPAWRHRFPHQLSGGQQQRIVIAMAFITAPGVVVMDEPTTGLDVSTQAKVLELVRELCARTRAAVVYVTHDLAVVSVVAPRLAVMYAGRLVEQGPTDAVMADPRHPYTRGLLAAVPDLDRPGGLVGITGKAPDPRTQTTGCPFSQRCPKVEDRCRTVTPPPVYLPGNRIVWCFATDVTGPEPITLTPRANVGTEAGPVLQVTGLCASYGRVSVVAGVDLAIARGESVALVGESGSGKTTIARSIAGVHREFTGDVILNGTEVARDVRRRSDEQRRLIQYVFQNPYGSLSPRRSIRQSLQQPLRVLEVVPAKDRERRAIGALDRVGLPAVVLDRRPQELSGGQRQRVAIARALVVEPALLICDEVTSSLDVSVQATVVALLEELRTQGLAMLFVTHNLALVPSVADRVVVLHRGHVVEAGSCSTVLGQPRSPEAADLIAALPRIPTG